jgi:hypothetical protein
MLRTACVALVAAVMSPTLCLAAVITTVVPVTQTVLGPHPGNPISTLLPRFVSQDVVFDTDGTDWLSAQIRVFNLEPGDIYQHDPPGAVSSPDPADFMANEALEFDTYVSNGTLNDPVVTTTGAVDLGGAPTSTFNANVIDIGWFTTDDDEIGPLALARVTLKNTARGTWSLRFTARPAGGSKEQFTGAEIIDGRLVIPEPATWALLGGLAMLSLGRRRRR